MTEGTIEQTDDRYVLRYERVFRRPVEVVWHAITDADEVRTWAGTDPQIDLRVGGEYVTHHASGDRVVDRIVRLEAPRLIEHTFWQHINPEALVTYGLEPISVGTRLVLTHILTAVDVQTAAEALSWRGDPYELVIRTSKGWPRLLDSLGQMLDGSRSRTDHYGGLPIRMR